MRLIMKSKVSGVRDGAPWPEVGESLDVSDDEGQSLIGTGLAELAASQPAAKPTKAKK